jgi:hypothetical protein
MENKNDKCIMVIAYYKEKNNVPLFSKEKVQYKTLLNIYGDVKELRDVGEVETYLFENNYLIKKEDGTYTVSRIGEYSFKNKRFVSEQGERINREVHFVMVLLGFVITWLTLLYNMIFIK